MQDCPNYVEDIAQSPDKDEGERKAIGGGATKIFYDLRRVYDDPTGYRYRSADVRMSMAIVGKEWDMYPQMPLRASTSRRRPDVGGGMAMTAKASSRAV